MKLAIAALPLFLVVACNEPAPSWGTPPAPEHSPTSAPTTPPAAPAAAPAQAIELPTSTPNMYSAKMADGTYDLYVGPGVKEAMQGGRPLPAGGWYRLSGVKQTRVDKAKGKAEKVVTLSLEDPASADMDIEISPSDVGKPSKKFKAGHPCISGVVQVGIDPATGSPSALFDIVEWVKHPNGPISKNAYTTGVLGDSDWPVLKNNAQPPTDCK